MVALGALGAASNVVLRESIEKALVKYVPARMVDVNRRRLTLLRLCAEARRSRRLMRMSEFQGKAV